ncbi:MAG: DUF4058 family protein [Caldilineaceae bacterium]
MVEWFASDPHFLPCCQGDSDAHPIPGMDPYLERPDLWPSFTAASLSPSAMTWRSRLRPKYYVAVEERLVHTAGDDVLFGMRPDASRRSERHAAWRRWPPTPRPRRWPAGGGAALDVITEAYLELRTVEDDYVVTVLELAVAHQRALAGDAPSTNSSACPLGHGDPPGGSRPAARLRRCPWSTRRRRRTIASSSAAVALDPWPTCTPLLACAT